MAQPISETSGNHAPLYPGDPESWWVEGAPLKLLAFALYTMPKRTGKAAQIKAELHSQVEPAVKWSHWWQQTGRMAAESDHFERKGSGPITLRADEIADIPALPLPPPAKKSTPARPAAPTKAQREWLRWFQGEGDAVPAKSGNPVKAAYDALDACPPESHRMALRRTMSATGRFLAADKRPKAAATEWAHLLSRAAQLWRNHPDAADGAETAAIVGELMAKLVQDAVFPEGCGRWLCQAGGLPDEQPEAWREGFAAGLRREMPLSGYDIRNWFDKAFSRTPQEHKAGIAWEIALAAFTGGAAPVSSAQFAQLDGLLSLLRDAEKSDFFQNLIIRSAAGKVPRQNVLNYIAGAHSELTPEARLNTMVLASLLLTDGSGLVVDQAAQDIGRALAGDDAAGDACSPPWEGLLAEVRQQFVDLRAGLTTRIDELRDAQEKQRHCYENGLAQRDAEVARLRAEIAAGREEARLDIRQDMLTVISETLYALRRQQGGPDEMLRLVEIRLALALRAGGAEEFGTVGETTPYDPVRHQSDEPIRPSSVVRIAAPGAIVKGKLTGDRVLVKARVLYPLEDEPCR